MEWGSPGVDDLRAETRRGRDERDVQQVDVLQLLWSDYLKTGL
ncbi:hypothetical protein N9L68_08880 [bacterium]|nr:hypothetical protein [bacterium]